MHATESGTTTLTIRMPQEMKRRIEDLAEATGRNKSYLALDALRRYLETESWHIAAIRRGIEDADAGRFATDDEMRAVWSEFGIEGDE
jgi:predicted transcriptional regulator